ncbi:MAG: cytochrome C [Deltaproteobacteria bacterium]|nr:MAG: cytochrome C [Deltaproteobacteria bacterium]
MLQSIFRGLSGNRRHRVVACLVAGVLLLPLTAASSATVSEKKEPGRQIADMVTKQRYFWDTVDHSKLKELQQVFTSGEQITDACLSCHTDADQQLKKTFHWTWTDPNSPEKNRRGKAQYSVNNFCLSTNAMHDHHCSECHIGWAGKGKAAAIDCLRCHGQKKFNFEEAFEDYEAFSTSGDEDDREMANEAQSEIQEAAQAVGRPTRRNCGSCHFSGGGGDGVKHGDLDSSMTTPHKSLDVHMGMDGQNFECVRCHTTIRHNVAGRFYATPAASQRESLIENDLSQKIMCESCHSAQPHKVGSKMNDHTDTVSCQTCHIPSVARVLPVQMWWDWSKAGKMKDGKPYEVKGPYDRLTYASTKGDTRWGKNVPPEYYWYSGSLSGPTLKDSIDPTQTIRLAWPVGSRKDKNARIFPFHVHRGQQPYDIERNKLLAPLLSGENGFWTTFDWKDAISRGQKFLDLPFSGKYGFVRTEYVFPSTHMVAPKDQALACAECHTRPKSRLANLTGFYMPGRDRIKVLDLAGWVLLFGSLCGVMLHGLGRFISNGKGRKG